LERALIITEAVFSHMSYVKGSTGTATTAEAALKGRMGVCQDYTHILISLLRSEGYAARYVCGIYPGAGTSHAWAEVLSNGIWIGIDPVNMKLSDDTYAVLARGADGSDTVLNKGIFFGNGIQHMECTCTLEEQ
ncbi:MAG: transglutaminase family protein, partial [Bullifex sp.]